MVGYLILFWGVLLASACASSANAANLPNGATLTPSNLDSYKQSSTYQDLTIREGAKMKDSMNFDDCHNPSYSLCVDWGPCDVRVFGVRIEVPSFGLEFKYWEPNAIVETVCSEGNTYYEDEMNLTSRMIGQKRILGDETTIAGLPAEKCIETIKTGGGMEGSSAMPRYYNEAHVWGVGILPRFMSSASTMEATVSSICGYAGLVGGLFSSFRGLRGDKNIDDFDSMSNDQIQAYSEAQGADLSSIPNAARNEESWFTDAYDLFASDTSAGGLAGFGGLDMTDTLQTAVSIGLGAVANMRAQSEDDIRPDKLCKRKKALEEVHNQAQEITNMMSQPGFDFEMFVQGAKVDDGVCPIGVHTGHTLVYDDDEFRGVRELPFWPNMCDGWKDEDCNRYPTGDTSTRISQVQISGLFPVCDGIVRHHELVQVNIQCVHPSTGEVISHDAHCHVDNRRYYYQGSPVSRSQLDCTGTDFHKHSSPRRCTLDLYGQYIESRDHRKQLNDYMKTAMEGSYNEAESETEHALNTVNQQITDLGGDCDSSGKPVGTWGDAVVGAALGYAAKEGFQAGLDYLQNSSAYQALSNSASDYAAAITGTFTEKAATEAAGEYVPEILNTNQFLADNLEQYLPQLSEDAGLDGYVGGFSGISSEEALDYFKKGMDVYKAATFDGAIQQAAVGMVTSNDPTGLWPAFMSEMSALPWRGKDIPKAMQLKGMIGTVGHLPCALGSIGTDIGLGSMGSGSTLAAVENWIGCVGTWGPIEPQNGFVYHRDGKIAAALAGYRAYKMAVTLRTIEDHNVKDSGRPMKINMDFPHKTDCFVPGTADLRWESKNEFDVQKAMAQAYSGSMNYLMEPFRAGNMVTAGTQFDSTTGQRTAASKQMETEQEGHVFTYWRKSKCCLYLVEYYGSWGPCWEVEREY
jgi:hypothetical protein